MRSAGPGKRASALLLTAAIGLAGPSVVAVPAAAQEDTTGYATPPPVSPGMLPPGGTSPDKNYVQKVGCVERDLNNQVKLQNAPWGQQFLRLDEVHRLMRSTTGAIGKKPNGQPVKVAVIDTGVTNHPFFGGRVQGLADYVKTTDKGPGLEDCDGHGTEVAGIIAAQTPEDHAFKGVAPDVQILSIRQSSQNYAEDDSPPPAAPPTQPPAGEGQPPGGEEGGEGRPPAGEQGGEGGTEGAAATGPAQNGGARLQEDEGSAGTLTTLAQAIVHATDSGADVINASINNCRSATGSITESEQRLQAAVRYAVDRDVVVVTAAGNVSDACQQNNQRDPNRPNSIVTPPWFAEDVLSVAAIDETGGVAPFSMNGPWVSVAAPGTKIISLDPAPGSSQLANLMIENGESKEIEGTSFAAPYVAGLAALVRAKFPDLDAREVMNRITSTAQHPAAPGGRDNYVGYGVIDPMAALTAMVPEEEGIQPAQAEVLPSDLPPADNRNWTPIIVALAGSGGAIVALVIALFVVHTIRRNKRTGNPSNRTA
ncbi:type VII secretion-associated serine protease mycosin [Prauserella oleivorans]|uniref:Type VII secretion-associated serine protease mycosin n=1 Tax=Prauserella oleivorans TaxID=1478153 RepID=A0ABW5W1N2_9PSEU